MKKSLIAMAMLAAIGESASAAWSRRSVDKEAFGHERRDLGTHMIQDSQLQLATAQSIAAVVSDIASTNIYDTGAAQDEGIGEEAELVVRTVAAVTSGGASTVQFVLQTDTATNFATAMVEFPLTAAIALAALTANTIQYRGRLPIGLKRYFRVVARIAAATTTGGSMDAFVLMNTDAQQYLPKNYTIS